MHYTLVHAADVQAFLMHITCSGFACPCATQVSWQASHWQEDAIRTMRFGRVACRVVQAMRPQGHICDRLASFGVPGELICREPLPILRPVCMVVAAHHVISFCIQPASNLYP